jgi:broad specificity phosphatase PhoE
MLEMIFETHSISVSNELAIATGWNDGELSEEGRRLAVELGERHRAQRPVVVFTSDLGRAVQTADVAFGTTGIPVHRDSRLRQCDYGELTGMSVERLVRERPRRIRTPFPGGESYQQVVEKVRGFLSDVSTGWNSGRIVVIGHSATKWALDYLVGGVPLEESVVGSFHWQPGWLYLLEGGPV